MKLWAKLLIGTTLGAVSGLVLFAGLNAIFDFSSIYQDSLSREVNNLLRDYAINATMPCYEDCTTFYYEGREIKDCDYREYCLAREVYYKMAGEFQYMTDPNEIYDSEYLLKTKRAECENLAILYCKVLYNIGIDCNVKCSLEHKHCFSVITYWDGTKHVADLTRKDLGLTYLPENVTDPFGYMDRVGFGGLSFDNETTDDRGLFERVLFDWIY